MGTHAVIQKDVRFHKLGMVVIDEQHRFGVQQRAALLQKAHHPHMLVMSATLYLDPLLCPYMLTWIFL